MIRLPFAVTCVLLSSCIVGPSYRAPIAAEPDNWSAARAQPDAAAALQTFWAGFNDPILNGLIQKAMDSNYELKTAGERIRAAHAAVGAVAAGGLPLIGVGTALESRRETQTVDWPPPSANYGQYPYYSFAFNASWELDLFGETRRRTESARAAADAVVETRNEILVSLTAAVAINYLSFRADELRLRIAQDNLDAARKTQRLARRAFEAGERSHLDVSEADTRVHGIEASIPPLRARSDDFLHALAILLGQAPVDLMAQDLSRGAELPAPPALPPLLPSQVIAQRPDIRKAERNYAQANANLGVAIAELYPHFTVPLSIGPTSSQVREMFQHASLLWRMGLDGSQSLYSGGRLTANVAAARANEAAALFSYRQTVLKAFGEVEDALSNQRAEEARYHSLTAQLADAQQSLLEARELYSTGQMGLLPVLEDQQLLYATQDTWQLSSLNRCLADIALYEALGGNWQTDTIVP